MIFKLPPTIKFWISWTSNILFSELKHQCAVLQINKIASDPIFQMVDIYCPISLSMKWTESYLHSVNIPHCDPSSAGIYLEAGTACCERYSYPHPLNMNYTNKFQSHSHLIMWHLAPEHIKNKAAELTPKNPHPRVFFHFKSMKLNFTISCIFQEPEHPIHDLLHLENIELWQGSPEQMAKLTQPHSTELEFRKSALGITRMALWRPQASWMPGENYLARLGPGVSELKRGPGKASALAKTTCCYSVLGMPSLPVPWSLPQARHVCIVPSKSGWLLAIWARTLNKGPQLKGHHLPLKPTLFPPQCPAQHLHFSSKTALPALGQMPRFPAAGSSPKLLRHL